MDAFLKMTACDLGRAIEAGEADPVAITAAFLEKIATHPEGDKIYARTTENRAMAEAEAAAQRAQKGARRGLLDGVPLSWKDLFDSAGTATESGSALLKGRVPNVDAEVLQRGTKAGAICLGKTHMSELAFSGLGLNPITATPPNIHGRALVPGGSSSGAAASVAFGLAPAAIGSDTGGSVRIPAAWNDLVGLKTTAGRLPLNGTVPLAASFDTVGPITRTVEDAAEIFAMLDGSSATQPAMSSLKGLRLMILDSVVFDDIRDAPRAAFEAAVDKLIAAGAYVERRAFAGLAEAMALSGVLYTVEAYAEWQKTIEAAPHLMFDRILERFRSGAHYSGVDYVSAWRKLNILRADYLKETAEFDAVLLPTAPILPPDVARLGKDEAYYVEENLLALRNTRVGNLLGLCALNLPAGVASCGITLQMPPMHEERLLQIGAAAERALAEGLLA